MKSYYRLIFCVLLWGCENQVNNHSQSNDKFVTAHKQMKTVSLNQWELIRNQYKDSILVVDLWASWCVSCLDRFPGMVVLSEKFASDNVQFVSLNLDEPSDIEALEWAANFLIKMEANFPHYHITNNMMESFEYLNLLGIPAVFIYDRGGREAFRLTGDNPNKQFGEADVNNAIVDLLD